MTERLPPGRTSAAQSIPESHRDLFAGPICAHLATIMPNGTPQVTPVWVMLDGDLVVVNSAKGEQKDRNMRARRRVALSILDPQNPNRYIAVRGPVVEITEQGAREVIDRLSEKYTGNAVYQGRVGEVRVTYKIRPDHVATGE